MQPGLGPADPVQRGRALDRHRRGGNLRVRVEVPEVEAAGAVDGGEEGGVLRRPGHVVHVVAVVLEGVERPVLLEAPQLDRPVHGGGQEEVAEVDGAGGRVRVQPGHGTLRLVDQFNAENVALSFKVSLSE